MLLFLIRLKKLILNSKLIKSTLKLASITMLANTLGFLIPIYIANTYGVTKETDDFLFSYGIITFISVMFSGAVSAACIPFLKERINKPIELNSFVSNVLMQIIKYIGLLSILTCIISLVIYSYSNVDLYFYLAISSPIFFFTILNAFYYGILNSFNQFNLAATSPFSRAIIIFLCIFLFSNSIGIYSAILGYNLGEIGKFLHLTYVINKKIKIKLSFKNNKISEISDFLKTGSYQAVSSTIAASSPLLDKIFAAFLPLGAISLLDYGSKLFMIFNVLLSSFLVIILSRWSANVALGWFNKSEFKRTIIYVMFGCLILFLLVLIFRMPVVNFLYPKLDPDEKMTIALLLSINMLGFVFNSGSQIINRAVVAFRATQVLVKISGIRVFINIILNFIFVYYYGLYGIVVSTVFTNIICFIVMYYLFISLEKFKEINLNRA